MELTNFNYGGQPVRTLMVDGEPRIVVADIAKILGYRDAANASRVLREHHRGYSIVSTPSGDQKMMVTTEAGFNRLIIRSNASNAEAVQDWVTDEVLPQIRRTGAYAAPALSGAELMAQALIEANSTMASYRARVEELTPMATAWEKLAAAAGDYSVRDAAQVLCRDGGIKVGQNRLFTHLKTAARPWLDKHSRPYQWAVDAGLVAEKISSFKFQRTNGAEQLAAPQVRITAKGLQRLHRELAPSADLMTA